MRPTPILIIGQIAHIVSTVFNRPMGANPLQNAFRIRVRRRQRGHTTGDVLGDLARLDVVALPFHPRHLRATNHRHQLRVLRAGDITHRTPPPFEPSMPFVVGLMNVRAVLPRQRWQLRQHGRWVVLDRRHHIIRATVGGNQFGRGRRTVSGIQGHRPPTDVSGSHPLPRRDDVVGVLGTGVWPMTRPLSSSNAATVIRSSALFCLRAPLRS